MLTIIFHRALTAARRTGDEREPDRHCRAPPNRIHSWPACLFVLGLLADLLQAARRRAAIRYRRASYPLVPALSRAVDPPLARLVQGRSGDRAPADGGNPGRHRAAGWRQLAALRLCRH